MILFINYFRQNATLQNSTPFEFDSGGFAFSQNTANFDLSRYWDDALYGLNVAFGTEFRVENYEINAGGQNSYASYDRFGQTASPTRWAPSATIPGWARFLFVPFARL